MVETSCAETCLKPQFSNVSKIILKLREVFETITLKH